MNSQVRVILVKVLNVRLNIWFFNSIKNRDSEKYEQESDIIRIIQKLI